MEQLPYWISLGFVLTTLLTLYLLSRASLRPWMIIVPGAAWLLLQMLVSLSGFYTVTDSFPPRFVLLAGPMLLSIIVIFSTKRGRALVDQLDLRALTLLHIVRIPVELVLYGLFLHRRVPEVMTFAGRNLDILSGISAPLVYYLVFVKRAMTHRALLIWNVLSLLLLMNIVSLAVLSAPFPFQQLAFDQPNVAVLYFPFTWLPGFVVPAVLFAHLAAFRQLAKRGKNLT